MWKGAAVFLLAALTIGWHMRYQFKPVEIPELPNQYWGPGKPVPDPTDVKSFKINIAKEVIDDLNDRLDKTRSLVEPLEGAAWTYGISSVYLKTVLNYWKKKYNWSQRQTLLNKYPGFKTKIQGLDIFFYHVKPNIPKDRKLRVLPLLLLHGWPGSFVEFQKIIPLLTTPSPDEDFVFELIIPSLPGYGFSQAAVRPGLGTAQMGVIFRNLMSRLRFEKFYIQGGDWGSVIASTMGILFPNNAIGIHLNMCFIQTPKSFALTLLGAFFPSLVIDNDLHSRMYPLSYHFSRIIEESGYMHIQSTKPDTVGTGLTDSPAGLAAYILEKFSVWTNPDNRFRDDGSLLEKFTLDELLDNIMIYWVTNSITTSQRLYAEHFNSTFKELGFDRLPVKVPVACANFPHELVYQPESLLRERYSNLIQLTHPIRGGHFAAMEEPELLSADIWSFVHKQEQLLDDDERTRKQKAKKA